MKERKPDGVIGRTIQPAEIFKIFGYKEDQEFGTLSCEDTKVDANKILSWVFAMLIYLKPGDMIETSSARFKKISDDLLCIDVNLDLKLMLDNVEMRRVIKIPV